MSIEKVVAAPKEVPSEGYQSLTKWGQLVKANLHPTQIICQEYKPMHQSVVACHSRLLTKRALPGAAINPKTKRPTLTGSAQSMLEHVRADHGGGFIVTFKRAEAGTPAWAGWAELASSGVEIVDFRCAWCEKPEGELNAGSILEHMKRAHRGGRKGLKVSDEFLMTLSFANANNVDDAENEEE